MKPTEILSSEHRVIEQVLDCLDRIIAGAECTGKLDAASAMDAINFFRMFADQCHHGKEEAHLFPAMEAKGFLRESGPTGVMCTEHEQGRACVRQMRDANADGEVQAFATAGRQFSALLRQHIQKEDHCLFSMADNAFNAADQAALLAKFEKSRSGRDGRRHAREVSQHR